MKGISAVLKVFDLIIRILTFLALGALVIVFMAGVIGRYVFNYSLYWSDELCRYLFVAVIFLGGISCAGSDSHTRIDIISMHIPEKYKNAYEIFIRILMCIFSVLLLCVGFAFTTANMTKVSSAMRIPMWWVYAVIPFSGFGMAVNSFRSLVKLIRNRSLQGGA